MCNSVSRSWVTNAGTREVRRLLKDVAGFDNGYDPAGRGSANGSQQFVTGVSWEALEHAGIIPESLRLFTYGRIRWGVVN